MKFFSNRPLITIIKHSLPCSFTSMYRNRLFEFPETCALHIQQPSDHHPPIRMPFLQCFGKKKPDSKQSSRQEERVIIIARKKTDRIEEKKKGKEKFRRMIPKQAFCKPYEFQLPMPFYRFRVQSNNKICRRLHGVIPHSPLPLMETK